MSAWWRPLACILAGLAVGLGALGAHALRDRLTEEALGWYQTGVWYHFAHAIGMWMAGGAGAGAGATPPGRRRRAAAAAAWLFLAGIFLFSGSLYLLAITGARGWGMVTPSGGIAFIGGWLALAFASLSRGRAAA